MAENQEILDWIFLTDLDSILDTRLGLISILDEDLAIDLLKNRKDKYYNRKVEKFGKWTTDEWLEHYRNRSKRVLRESVPTNLIRLATGYMAIAELEQSGSPVPQTPRLLVNTFPYELMEEERDLILKALVAATKGTINLELTYRSYADISPLWLRTNVAVYATYNFREWLETQSMTDAFSRHSCPDTVILAPAIVHDESLEDDNEIFATMTKTFRMLFSVEFIPVEEFSIAVPEELDKD